MTIFRVLDVRCPVHGSVTTQVWWRYWEKSPCQFPSVPFDRFGWNGRVTPEGIRTKPTLRHQDDCGETLLWFTESEMVPV